MLVLPYCYSYVPNCFAALWAMNMNLMCVSVAILILTALDDRARATVSASQIEHLTDGERKRNREEIID